MDHAFNTNIAKLYDVNIAILLHNFKFWTFNNLANKRNMYDGLCWSYDTLEALMDIFPYWTRRQIETVINKAVKAELLRKGNYNQTKYDRTVWYALTPKGYAFYPELLKEKYLESLYLSISPKCEMDFTEWRNGFPQSVTPIPDTKPDTDPYINNKGTNVPQDNENNNSDENSNQTLEVQEATEGLEGAGSVPKSDYRKNQTKKKSYLQKIERFDINNILQNNNFQIPPEMIQDWVANRNKKRAPVTSTAWSRIVKVLEHLKENNINPIEAFERMVANGWQSIEISYFQQELDSKKQSAPKSLNTSPLSMDDDLLFKEFRHVCRHSFKISDTLKTRIDELMNRLKKIDHPIAREIISEIGKLEEIHASKDFSNMASRAEIKSLKNAC